MSHGIKDVCGEYPYLTMVEERRCGVFKLYVRKGLRSVTWYVATRMRLHRKDAGVDGRQRKVQ
jgi:hypothetical protein